MIARLVARDHTLTIVLNLTGFVLFTAILFAVTFVAGTMLSPRNGLLIAGGLTVAFLAVGILTGSARDRDDQRLIDLPWDAETASGYVARREALKVVGTARLGAEIILGASGCLLKALRAWRLRRMILGCTDEEIADVAADLARSARAGTRFVPFTAAVAGRPATKALLLNEVLWCKQDQRQMLIGLNRRFDQHV